MLVYRISRVEFIDDLAGNGAKLFGGRWNEQGVALVYFASTRAMAVMELLVHLSGDDLERDYSLAVFEVPDNSVAQIEVKDLPKNWTEEKHEGYLKSLGDNFILDAKKLLLKVPSSLVEEEYNVLMNPNHPGAIKAKMISKRTFTFDRRLKN